MADYGTVAGFRAYHLERGRVTTQWEDDEVEAKKLVASEWLDGKYRASFSGTKVGQRLQVREWPRNGAVDRDGYAIDAGLVPVEAEHATYEATYRELQSPGALSVDWTPSIYKRAAVEGAVSVEFTQFGAASDVQTQFAIIDTIIEPILTGGVGGGNVSSLSGAITRI